MYLSKFVTALTLSGVIFAAFVFCAASVSSAAEPSSTPSQLERDSDDVTPTESAQPELPSATVAATAGGAEAKTDAPPPRGTPPKDMKNFTEWLFGYDDINTPSASTLAGLAYLKGKGVKQDFVKARELLQKAVQVSDGAGTTQLGLMYLRGIGVDKDLTKAAELLKHAAEYGVFYPDTGNENNGDAQYELGVASDTGAGLSKNVGNAYMWFKLACESISDNKPKAAARLKEIGSRLTPEEKDQYSKQLAVWKENQKIAITPKLSGNDPGPKN